MRRAGTRAWRSAAALAAGLLVVAFAEPSAAASRMCRQLQAELVAAGNGGKSQFRKYDRALASQREQLLTVKRRARQARCGFGIFSPRGCGALNDQIERMEGNIAALERKRDQSGGGAPTRSRSRILAALDANGCRDEAEASERRQPLDEGDVEIDTDLFARLFGHGAVSGAGIEGGLENEPLDQQGDPTNVTRILNPNGEVDVYGPQGLFSTMCVRICDGYFFPGSPNSSSADFARDQRNCEATCPGTEVQLYYRPPDSYDSETMLSAATGQPYGSLPAAYVYKDITKPRVPACGCKGAMLDPSYAVVAGEAAVEEAPAEPVIPVPAMRPDPALDPETLANAEGKLDLETIRRILKPKPVAVPILPPGERKVRVVGPVFLPDPEGAIDLKAPARKDAR
jgi:hypothetical protein